MIRFVIVLAIGLFLASDSAHAEDQLLNLFPKQRAEHQAKMDNNEGKYLARGQAYVDHMYATGGEEPMTELEDLDLELGDDSTVAIDTAEVAKIIKQGVPQ